ncbi:MAG: NUDIX domain-containing protein [Anaerolineae bacterium]|nr:NUDIX domain-containing protein [Anaerolineae bacterium]
MAKVIYGDRIGRTARLSTGCSAFIFDPMGERILLTRRTDNGQWCLPGGRMEAGESLAETCIREVWEETGLSIRIVRLIGVYSTPNQILTYADGNRWQIISHSFEAEVIGGELVLSDETTEFGYFTPDEIAGMDVMEHHRERIADGLSRQSAAFIR